MPRRCGACDYDLTGLEPERPLCPECGSSLCGRERARVREVRFFQRLGLVLTLALLGIGGLFAVAVIVWPKATFYLVPIGILAVGPLLALIVAGYSERRIGDASGEPAE